MWPLFIKAHPLSGRIYMCVASAKGLIWRQNCIIPLNHIKSGRTLYYIVDVRSKGEGIVYGQH